MCRIYRVLTFKLPGQQIPQPAFQQWGDAPHEEQPHSPAWSPETTARTFAHRPLEEQRHGKSRSFIDIPESLPRSSVYMGSVPCGKVELTVLNL